jgi:hypothetical protein
MIARVRELGRGDRSTRRRAPVRLGTLLLVAAAFFVAGTSAMAATTSVAVDQGLDVSAVADTTTAAVDPAPVAPAPADPAPADPAPADPAPSVQPLDAVPAPAPDPPPATAVTPAPAPVTVTPDPVPTTTPAATTGTTATAATTSTSATSTPVTSATAQPAPDQLSPGLLAQVSPVSADVAPSKGSGDPPPIAVARTIADIEIGSAATPAMPPPVGDEPPGALAALRKLIPRPAALVPVLMPDVPAGAAAAAPPPRQEVTATRARPVWTQYVWRDVGRLGGGSDLGLSTRALLAIIGMLPFAPVDGPDRTAPPLSQLALLIPVLALVAFLFATRPIADPRRRGPQSYRAVALKPG